MIFSGIGGPHEGLWIIVGFPEEAINRGLEIDDRAEHATFEAALGQLGKEALDGVEPGGRDRRVVEHKARMPAEPGPRLGMFVRAVIVENHVNDLADWDPCERQMRCTEETLIRTNPAIAAAVQCVVSPGGSLCVSATTRSPMAGGSGGTREGRVLSCNRPSTPVCMNRSCQRHRQVLLLAVCRMISLVPRPSAVNSTIRARHTCFWGLFRSG